MTNLLQNNVGVNARGTVSADPVLQTGAILIDQDAYTAGLTYTYDTRGFDEAFIQIINEGGANGLTYTIEKTRKNYTTISALVDADFDGVIQADANIAFGAEAIHALTAMLPEISAIRIRVKRQTTVLDTTFGGIINLR